MVLSRSSTVSSLVSPRIRAAPSAEGVLLFLVGDSVLLIGVGLIIVLLSCCIRDSKYAGLYEGECTFSGPIGISR